MCDKIAPSVPVSSQGIKALLGKFWPVKGDGEKFWTIKRGREVFSGDGEEGRVKEKGTGRMYKWKKGGWRKVNASIL